MAKHLNYHQFPPHPIMRQQDCSYVCHKKQHASAVHNFMKNYISCNFLRDIKRSRPDKTFNCLKLREWLEFEHCKYQIFNFACFNISEAQPVIFQIT